MERLIFQHLKNCKNMRYLLDTNVFYHLANPSIEFNSNYLPLDWFCDLFVSPLSVSELLCSEKTLESRANAAYELTRVLGIEILKPVNSVLAEHYGINTRNVKEDNLKNMLNTFIYVLGKRIGNRIYLNELLKDVCYKHKEAGIFMCNTSYSVKEKLLQYFGKNLDGKLSKDEIGHMLKDINVFTMFNNIFIKRLKVVCSIDVSNCKELPTTLYPYANAQLMYTINLLMQGTKPKKTDWIDIEHFLYCNLYVDKIYTNDTSWFKMLKQHKEFHNLSDYIEKPSFRKHEFLAFKEEN